MPKINEQKKDAVRADILNAARKVFIEKGYEATSMKDIVTNSGRSFGGVYLYFSNKEAVFLELLRRQFENMAMDLKSESRIQISTWDKVANFLEEQKTRVKEVENGVAACMYEYFIVGRREESRRKLIEERYQAVYGSIFTLIQEGVLQKEFQPSQPIEVFVHWLISSLDGLFMEGLMNGIDGIELDKQFELLKTVCRSILMPNRQEGD